MAQVLTLSIDVDRRSERVADLVREIVSDLRRERTLEAEQRTAAPQPGERSGDVAMLGQIILTFMSAGAATALIGCLKTYLERDPSLRIRLKRPDGSELELEGKHVDARAMHETVRALQRLAEM